MAHAERRSEQNRRGLILRGGGFFAAVRAAHMAAAVLILAGGYAQAGSNLSPAGYPDPQCGEQPEPPVRPDQFRFRAELDVYNEQVTAFNKAEERYVACIQAYVQNAVSDIAEIRKKIDQAVASARR